MGMRHPMTFLTCWLRSAVGYIYLALDAIFLIAKKNRGRRTESQNLRNKENQRMAAEEGQVIACHTTEAWDEQLKKGNETKKLIVVDFTASWCGPCRFIAPILSELAKKHLEATFLKVDVDELKTVAEDWAVEAMPTFIFLKEGKIVDKVVGAKKDELVSKVNQHVAAPATASASA